MTISNTIGNIIALVLACMWTVASQAHFTAEYTPEIAAGVSKTTAAVAPAFKFSGLSVEQIQQILGTLGAATAVFLWLPQTRRLGCRAAAFVTFFGRVFPQFMVEDYKPDDMVVVAGSAAAATLAAVLLD